jgi:hypothetical protein
LRGNDSADTLIDLRINLRVDYQGGVPKWLRERSAKPPFCGSNPHAASISFHLPETSALEHFDAGDRRCSMSPTAEILRRAKRLKRGDLLAEAYMPRQDL